MNEVCRISAAQQLQRLDSFLMEANVTKIEKVNLHKESQYCYAKQKNYQNAEKAREDMKWEFEQLKVSFLNFRKLCH